MKYMSKEYRKRIIIDSKIHFGKTCEAGTRIPAIYSDGFLPVIPIYSCH
jgi:hypothetical protein